jgi:hypothetical protein
MKKSPYPIKPPFTTLPSLNTMTTSQPFEIEGTHRHAPRAASRKLDVEHIRRRNFAASPLPILIILNT